MAREYDNIADAISAVNGEVAEQSGKIADILEALEGKGVTEITDGIIVKARNASGYPTELDFYGTVVHRMEFGASANSLPDWEFRYLEKVNFKNEITEFGYGAFYNSQMTEIEVPATVTSIGQMCFTGSKITSIILPRVTVLTRQTFSICASLVTAKLPYTQQLLGSGNMEGDFRGCTALQTVEIGSIGYDLNRVNGYTFKGCSQTGLTITVYCKGNYVDSCISSIRTGATNATIIIKASEDTTYNGVSYSAGDTMITSEVA